MTILRVAIHPVLTNFVSNPHAKYSNKIQLLKECPPPITVFFVKIKW